jgi:hypothetical protein
MGSVKIIHRGSFLPHFRSIPHQEEWLDKGMKEAKRKGGSIRFPAINTAFSERK